MTYHTNIASKYENRQASYTRRELRAIAGAHSFYLPKATRPSFQEKASPRTGADTRVAMLCKMLCQSRLIYKDYKFPIRNTCAPSDIPVIPLTPSGILIKLDARLPVVLDFRSKYSTAA